MEEQKKLYDYDEEDDEEGNIWFIVFNITEGYTYIVRAV